MSHGCGKGKEVMVEEHSPCVNVNLISGFIKIVESNGVAVVYIFSGPRDKSCITLSTCYVYKGRRILKR